MYSLKTKHKNFNICFNSKHLYVESKFIINRRFPLELRFGFFFIKFNNNRVLIIFDKKDTTIQILGEHYVGSWEFIGIVEKILDCKLHKSQYNSVSYFFRKDAVNLCLTVFKTMIREEITFFDFNTSHKLF